METNCMSHLHVGVITQIGVFPKNKNLIRQEKRRLGCQLYEDKWILHVGCLH